MVSWFELQKENKEVILVYILIGVEVLFLRALPRFKTLRKILEKCVKSKLRQYKNGTLVTTVSLIDNFGWDRRW